MLGQIAQQRVHPGEVSAVNQVAAARLTTDQTGVSELFEVKRQGGHGHAQCGTQGSGGRPDQARTHPKRSELRSALGIDGAALLVDHSGQPRPVDAGDVFLLCSDGVWEHVTEQCLEDTLRDAATPRAWLAALEQAVGAATRDKSSHDNFTALTVWARGADAH